MKCLFVALGVYTGVGGIERFNQRVLRTLAELGDSDGLESQAVVLWDTAERATRAPHLARFFPGGSHKLATAARFLWQVWRTQPEIVLYGHLLLSPLASIARLLSPRSRHILIVHGWEVWLEPFRKRVPLWERLAVRLGIDEVISVSRFTAGRMAEAYRLPESMFHILPNAVDSAEAAAAPVRRDGTAKRLLTVTRLSGQDTYKGCDQVIRAMPQILARVPEASYDLAGEGELRPRLERLAEQMGVRDRVRFHGYVDDRRLADLYESASLMVMPSTGEGFGIVYLEAWKHQLPVVSGNRDASAEVVTHGRDGLCVDPRSVDQIAEAVTALLSDPERAAAMGREGYRTMTGAYTHAHFRRNLRRIFHAGDTVPACWEAQRT
jgi:glycosyltransferase involved in cell wall biosynthesis